MSVPIPAEPRAMRKRPRQDDVESDVAGHSASITERSLLLDWAVRMTLVCTRSSTLIEAALNSLDGVALFMRDGDDGEDGRAPLYVGTLRARPTIFETGRICYDKLVVDVSPHLLDHVAYARKSTGASADLHLLSRISAEIPVDQPDRGHVLRVETRKYPFSDFFVSELGRKWTWSCATIRVQAYKSAPAAFVAVQDYLCEMIKTMEGVAGPGATSLDTPCIPALIDRISDTGWPLLRCGDPALPHGVPAPVATCMLEDATVEDTDTSDVYSIDESKRSAWLELHPSSWFCRRCVARAASSTADGFVRFTLKAFVDLVEHEAGVRTAMHGSGDERRVHVYGKPATCDFVRFLLLHVPFREMCYADHEQILLGGYIPCCPFGCYKTASPNGHDSLRDKLDALTMHDGFDFEELEAASKKVDLELLRRLRAEIETSCPRTPAQKQLYLRTFGVFAYIAWAKVTLLTSLTGVSSTQDRMASFVVDMERPVVDVSWPESEERVSIDWRLLSSSAPADPVETICQVCRLPSPDGCCACNAVSLRASVALHDTMGVHMGSMSKDAVAKMLVADGQDPRFWLRAIRSMVLGSDARHTLGNVSLALVGGMSISKTVAIACSKLWAVLQDVVFPRCPICRSAFELDSGCTHVCCGKCGHHHCYTCGRQFLGPQPLTFEGLRGAVRESAMSAEVIEKTVALNMGNHAGLCVFGSDGAGLDVQISEPQQQWLDQLYCAMPASRFSHALSDYTEMTVCDCPLYIDDMYKEGDIGFAGSDPMTIDTVPNPIVAAARIPQFETYLDNNLIDALAKFRELTAACGERYYIHSYGVLLRLVRFMNNRMGCSDVDHHILEGAWLVLLNLVGALMQTDTVKKETALTPLSLMAAILCRDRAQIPYCAFDTREANVHLLLQAFKTTHYVKKKQYGPLPMVGVPLVRPDSDYVSVCIEGVKYALRFNMHA